ncbi:MAG: 3-oxoacyl-[acyl-carrier-protein] reductase [Candidatus Omnitrophica bacterium]|nr:3-oxoacyl-[acyl-carrier-protein] reductase [Candidatus Omnitrophota bacterium]MBU1869441.1 3-oxoacyl-[acyl-carrier-protein] reductase [Candidatus Omnitrophota bacterium]
MLKNKVAIVSGGTRGIGRGICLMLAQEGADVAFTYLKSVDEAASLKKEIEKSGVKALALQVDVRDFDKTKEAVENVKTTLGGLDIIVNNAGITRDKALMMMSKEDWQDVIDTNLTGTFNLSRNAIVAFLKQKSGNIVNITSVSGVIGLARQTNYASSKAGIIGFTKSLAREVSPYGIRVNAVAPGFIETDMVSDLKPEYKGQLIKNIPLERFGKVEDVTGVVKFLLSEASSFITGQVMIIDGGLSIR